mgnify:CR=1 FL=1
MSEWKRYKLSELYEMSSGISSTKEQAGHGSPFLSFSVVFNNYFLPDSLIDLMDTTDGEKQKYSINEGDIFLTRTSETVDELAMSSVALKDYPEASFSGFLKRLRPVDKTIVYPKFMAFYLRSPLFRRTIINNTVMTLRASFNEAMFSYLEIMLPDFDTQKKIGDFLYSLEKKKQINNQINQELEAMAKTLYDYWFVQFDFPDQNGKPYKSSGGKMVYNSELKREIPEGWGVEKLEKIANITMGQSPKGTSYNEVGEGMLFFQGSTDFGWRFPVARQYTTEPSRIAEEDDILLSVRAPVGTLNIADTRCCIGRGLAAINSKVGANSYIFNVMQDFKKLFDMINSVGTTFGSITKDDLYSLQLVYPPTELLMEFDQLVKSFDREIKNRSRQNQELNQLRDWLLPMLMNGQVKVE